MRSLSLLSLSFSHFLSLSFSLSFSLSLPLPLSPPPSLSVSLSLPPPLSLSLSHSLSLSLSLSGYPHKIACCTRKTNWRTVNGVYVKNAFWARMKGPRERERESLEEERKGEREREIWSEAVTETEKVENAQAAAGDTCSVHHLKPEPEMVLCSRADLVSL